jgi:hypothetical protein
MLNDPDGRCPMCIGFMIGMFTSAIGNAISGTMPKNIGQFLLPGVQGAIGGGIASAIGGAFAGMGGFAGKGLLQAGTHALSGGLQSAAFGGNFWQGAASSGISSGFASGSDALGLGGVGQLLAGGLSGGVASELFGGNFWDGARNGLIVSGLNHLSQHGGGEDGYGKLYGNETEAYNFAWKNSVGKTIEHGMFLLKEGVFVSDIKGNGYDNDYGTTKDFMGRYTIRNGNILINGKSHRILGHVHTHPALDKLGGLSQDYTLYSPDLNISFKYKIPVFALSRNNKVYGYDHYNGGYFNMKQFSVSGILSGKQSLLKFLKR